MATLTGPAETLKRSLRGTKDKSHDGQRDRLELISDVENLVRAWRHLEDILEDRYCRPAFGDLLTRILRDIKTILFDLSGQLTAAKDISQKARETALKKFGHVANHPLVLFFKRPATRLRLLQVAHAIKVAELVIAAFRLAKPSCYRHSSLQDRQRTRQSQRIIIAEEYSARAQVNGELGPNRWRDASTYWHTWLQDLDDTDDEGLLPLLSVAKKWFYLQLPPSPNNVAPRHCETLDFAEFQARLSAEIRKVELNAARQVADLRVDCDVRAERDEKEKQGLKKEVLDLDNRWTKRYEDLDNRWTKQYEDQRNQIRELKDAIAVRNKELQKLRGENEVLRAQQVVRKEQYQKLREAHLKLQETNDQLTAQLETAAVDRPENEWCSAPSHLTSNSGDSPREEMEARHNALMKEKDEEICALKRDIQWLKGELKDVIKARAFDTGHPDFERGREKVRPYSRPPIKECQNAYRPPPQETRATRKSRSGTPAPSQRLRESSRESRNTISSSVATCVEDSPRSTKGDFYVEREPPTQSSSSHSRDQSLEPKQRTHRSSSKNSYGSGQEELQPVYSPPKFANQKKTLVVANRRPAEDNLRFGFLRRH